MPSAGTPKRPIRIDDDLWQAALAKAARCGTTVAEQIRESLARWVAEPDKN